MIFKFPFYSPFESPVLLLEEPKQYLKSEKFVCVKVTSGRDFPSGPLAETLYFQCRNLGSIPGQGPTSHVLQ